MTVLILSNTTPLRSKASSALLTLKDANGHKFKGCFRTQGVASWKERGRSRYKNGITEANTSKKSLTLRVQPKKGDIEKNRSYYLVNYNNNNTN